MSRVLAVSGAVLWLLGGGTAPDETIQGFTPESSVQERRWEQTFQGLPSPENQREFMRRLSARPHHVGSPYDKDNAEWILARFKEWGWDARIETFSVLFPTPKERLLEMVEPTRFVASLKEPPLPQDPTSGQTQEQLPTYNAYSVDGDVVGALVFVNYGLPKDYEALERLGVSVKGAIVIARYGNSWRGIKPKVAAEHGAVGCLIYSDPADDGYAVDEVFPEGPMRPPAGVQRGSVMDFASSQPGDPLTPGVGATPEARRIPLKDAQSLTKIPVLPISYGDAQPLLAALKGPMAPEAFKGALAISYHVGPGPAKVHLKLAFNWDQKPVYDVVARLAGTEAPEEWVLRGNHHDGWVNGAEDPLSGQVALLEEARALGELHRQGWKPRRTIIYCAWDGEEPMLLGSTEWVETHEAELASHAVAYINTDGNGRGPLIMGGSHALEHFVNGVARDLPDPESQMSVWKRLQLIRISQAASDEARGELRTRPDLRMDALGSGTDFTAFLDHVGVASVDIAYAGEDPGGIYHSIYDDFYWFTHFSDRDFAYGRLLSLTVGSAVMRLADAEVLPFEYKGLADTVDLYLKQLKTLAKEKRDFVVERNREIDEGLFKAVFDPRRPTVAPGKEEVPPFLNFAPFENGAEALRKSADRLASAQGGARDLSGEALRALNAKFMESERRLLTPDGLPRRAWYRHLLYAPGVYSGYDPKTVPGVREAIEQKRWAEADAGIVAVGDALRREAALLDEATALLQPRKP
jgi:N-acetylated-alpha-linked acidic dipeptidase